MATKEMTHRQMVLSLKEAGYTDAGIAVALNALLPRGAPMPSVNSIRRWRYGSSKPSPYYAALLERLYLRAVSRGVLKEVSHDE
jgi:hypothetical protein